jgi:hypothetical protein
MSGETRGGLADKKCYHTHPHMYICCMLSVNNNISVQVINKPCARRIEYMRLIPWTRHRGSEQI